MKNKGSNLVEYVIPVAVIGLVIGTSMFYMFHDGKMLNYLGGSGDTAYDEASNKIVINQNPEPEDLSLVNPPPGFLDGTPDAPQKACQDNLCTIDYGTFVLKNVPSNFNDFVQTAGASGGSEMISNLLTQIANQLENEGQLQDSLEVMKLASLGHNIAAIEKSIETMVNDCNHDTACVQSYLHYYHDENGSIQYINNEPFPRPEGIDDRFYDYPSNLKYHDAIYLSTIGMMQNNKKEKPSSYTRHLNDGYYSASYIEQLESITNNSNLSDDMKGVIRELSWDLGIMGEDFQNMLSFMTNPSDTQGYFDPLTGESTSSTKPENVVDSFQNYNASTVTNFDSALICSAGYNEDTGSFCH
jgi:hypothetical protein